MAAALGPALTSDSVLPSLPLHPVTALHRTSFDTALCSELAVALSLTSLALGCTSLFSPSYSVNIAATLSPPSQSIVGAVHLFHIQDAAQLAWPMLCQL